MPSGVSSKAQAESRATGKPITIRVAEVPRVGRPPSFAGAVGAGYSLEVDADRSVVQLGEPIMLSFHLRGDGDLSSASLPALVPPSSVSATSGSVRAISAHDGLKLTLDDGFLMLRGSMTEPVLRIYAEARGPRLLRKRLAAGERLLGVR